MTQTLVLAAHLDNHGDLIADPNVPSDHLITTFPLEAFETLWEPKGWVAVNRAGEPVADLEFADPDKQDVFYGEADRAQIRKDRVRKFSRSKDKGTSANKAEKAEG